MVIHFACQKLDTKALPKLTRKCIFVREFKFYKKELLEEGMLAETKNFDQRESFFFLKKIRIATVFFLILGFLNLSVGTRQRYSLISSVFRQHEYSRCRDFQTYIPFKFRQVCTLFER